MNKTMLSVFALGLVAMFFGSAVYATSTADIASAFRSDVKIPAVLPVMKDIKTPAPALVKASSATKMNTDVRPVDPRALMPSREKVVEKIQDEKRANPDTFGKFVSAVAKVKQAIVKDKKEGNGDSTFAGWSIQRIVNASGLSADTKTTLLDALKGSRLDDTTNWERHTFLMWNSDKSYASIGKMTLLNAGDSMTFFARGFSSTDDHRFFFFGSNGTMAGVQNGKVFWGTYANGTGNITFDDGTSTSIQYMLYG